MTNKSITIIHGLPDTNPGGSALGISLINVLRNHFPDYEIKFVSRHSREDLVGNAHLFIQSKLPDIKLYPYPIKARSDNYDISNNLRRKLYGFFWSIKTVLSLLFVIFPFLRKYKKKFKNIFDCSLMISRGTQIFYDKKGTFFRSIISLYWLCFPLLMAWRCKIPFIIYAQSFGPLHYRLNRWIIRFVFNRATLVLAREKLSSKYLIQTIGVSSRKVKIVPDSVFSLDPPEESEIKKYGLTNDLPYKKFLAISIRSLMDKSVPMETIFLKLDKIIQYLFKKKYIEEVVIITQCHHFEKYKGFESDSEVSKKFYDYLSKNAKNYVKILDKYLNPDELFLIYGGARYLISVRLHAAIIALISGTPAIAFSYWGHKTKGIMEMLDLTENVFEIMNFEANNLIRRLEIIEINYKSEVQKIIKSVNEIRYQAKNTPLLFKKTL